MNWPQTIAFGFTWLMLGARMLEANLPAMAKLHRPALRPLKREGL